ncbi:MAG: Crp/Fnr family transcriptional regulator [Bacteroidales bacterium]|nr:Crp/Fnr family transcriptional regulator [Bacteroidales bacterium]
MSVPESINNCRECKKASQCFQHLYPNELEFINDKKIQLTYLQGENLFKQGAFSPYVMYIAEGLVKVYLQTGPEKQMNLRLARTGEFLAVPVLFGENVYHYSAVAVKDSTICMIDKTGLKQLMQKNPDFAMRIASRNCRNEEHLLEIIKNISYKQMRGELASALLYLSADEYVEQDVFQYLTRQDIADFANIAAESTIKFLKEFEKEGLLALKGKDIIIMNKDRLSVIGRRG